MSALAMIQLRRLERRVARLERQLAPRKVVPSPGLEALTASFAKMRTPEGQRDIARMLASLNCRPARQVRP